MPPIKLFISYRSLDAAKVDAMVARLKSLKEGEQPLYEVWQDKQDILPGQDWWGSILDAIEACTIFVFCISQESLKSSVCLTELGYAIRRNRPIVPIVLEGEFRFNPETDRPELIDWSAIPRDLNDLRAQFLFYIPGEFYTLFRATAAALQARRRPDAPHRRPAEPDGKGAAYEVVYDKACVHAYNLEFEEAQALFRQLTHRQESGFAPEALEWLGILNQYEQIIQVDAVAAAHFRLPMLWAEYKKLFPKHFIKGIFDPRGLDQQLAGAGELEEGLSPTPDKKPLDVRRPGVPRKPTSMIMAGVSGVMVLIVVIAFVLAQLIKPSAEQQNIAKVNTLSPTVREEENLVPTSPSLIQTVTATETADVVKEAQRLLEAQIIQTSISAATGTAAKATDDEAARRTESANLTATATLWTATATPNLTASVAAVLTGWWSGTATEIARQACLVHTLEAGDTLAALAVLYHIDRNVLLQVNDLDDELERGLRVGDQIVIPLEGCALIKSTPQTSNAAWEPYKTEQDFDGVAMVLVPAGCFEMGSEDGSDDEKPVSKQCLKQPFWMDKYEVTNEQFGQFKGVSATTSQWTEDKHPREQITWFEARDFCQLRGGRLPTEAEWEYAARGPDNLVYPWGNEWEDGRRVVWAGNANNQTAEVGEHPDGVSWVGAEDMAGNVWEWVSSWYQGYPYDAADGREADVSNKTNVLYRVLRGGSWGLNSSGNFRAAFRNDGTPENGVSYVGFRCVRSFE